ncbi:MAG: archaeosortase/exosortase family protein [Balneolaceae bacterium]|nr:archaeosortase/exosortase family protein [Balneolaceae bacterium]MBO6546921.1 archaeosortase/exosortase family protein [Balneolaceae bacterium]MBO6649281.1 archaeosortase/exosortase family protein [Balneolaceae bacterium]
MNFVITKFIAKAFAVFILWYIVYELWLLPDGNLDEWLALNIVAVSTGIIDFFGYEVWSVHRIIGIGENAGIELVDGCTGISAIGLFLGFILAYPGEWKSRISFSLLGIGVIYIVNILRIVVLVITQEEWIEFFDFTHDYSTTTIFYIVIFIMWMTWVKFNDENFSTSKSIKNA